VNGVLQCLCDQLFEPVHGSAPDIAGMGIANPTGAFLSAAMMLDWLGHPSPAAAIRESCAEVLCNGGTPDVGGAMGTEAATDAVIEAMLRRATP
jgi:isocitrate/isopropylmalate dehydrogenase